MAPRPLQSMLTLRSGHDVRMSLSSGTASRPPMRAPAYLLVGDLRHGAGQVGDPVERRVVERDDDPVGGGVDVGLDVPVTQVDRRGEGDHRVLDAGVASRERAAAVCHRQGQTAVVEEGVVVRAAQPPHTQQYGAWVRPRRRCEPAAPGPSDRVDAVRREGELMADPVEGTEPGAVVRLDLLATRAREAQGETGDRRSVLDAARAARSSTAVHSLGVASVAQPTTCHWFVGWASASQQTTSAVGEARWLRSMTARKWASACAASARVGVRRALDMGPGCSIGPVDCRNVPQACCGRSG